MLRQINHNYRIQAYFDLCNLFFSLTCINPSDNLLFSKNLNRNPVLKKEREREFRDEHDTVSQLQENFIQLDKLINKAV